MELWKQPISFSANRGNIPPYPVLCLPEPIRSMAERAKEFDPEIPATYYLTVCSSLFSNLFEVSCFGDTVQLNLFSFIFENPAVKGFITRSYLWSLHKIWDGLISCTNFPCPKHCCARFSHQTKCFLRSGLFFRLFHGFLCGFIPFFCIYFCI